MKRGLNQQEAMEYVGAKRRTWEALWAPRLVGIPQGVSLIYDRQDLDALFDVLKKAAAGGDTPQDAANDDHGVPEVQNQPRNGWPVGKKGNTKWAKKCGESTPKWTEVGKSTSGTAVLDFASAVSSVMKKRKAG